MRMWTVFTVLFEKLVLHTFQLKVTFKFESALKSVFICKLKSLEFLKILLQNEHWLGKISLWVFMWVFSDLEKKKVSWQTSHVYINSWEIEQCFSAYLDWRCRCKCVMFEYDLKQSLQENWRVLQFCEISKIGSSANVVFPDMIGCLWSTGGI